MIDELAAAFRFFRICGDFKNPAIEQQSSGGETTRVGEMLTTEDVKFILHS